MFLEPLYCYNWQTTIASIPLVVYLLNTVYRESFVVVIIALFTFLTWAVIFTTRFAILGISNARTILIVDSVSTALKFVSGYILVSLGFGSAGILGSILLFNMALAAISLTIVIRLYGFTLSRIGNVFMLAKEGLANMPSIISRTLIYSLSVVLVAAAGIDYVQVGTYYFALMMSLLAGSLITSSAYMLIPFSSSSGSDVSLGATRIALSFTVPVIVALISTPEYLLSLIGQDYLRAQLPLVILSIGLIPFSIVTMSISRLNYLGESRKLIMIGIVQVASFTISFAFLIYPYGIVGVAGSISLSYLTTAIVCIVWSNRLLLRYTATSLIAVAAGGITGYSFHTYSGLDPLSMLLSSSLSLLVLIILKNTSIAEIRTLFLSLASGGRKGNDEKKNAK